MKEVETEEGDEEQKMAKWERAWKNATTNKNIIEIILNIMFPAMSLHFKYQSTKGPFDSLGMLKERRAVKIL